MPTFTYEWNCQQILLKKFFFLLNFEYKCSPMFRPNGEKKGQYLSFKESAVNLEVLYRTRVNA